MDIGMDGLLRGRRFKQVVEQHYAPLREKYALKQIEVEVLCFLSKWKDATATDVWQTLNLNKGHVSQAFDALSKKGYLTAFKQESDKRCTCYAITPAAEMAVEEIGAVRRELLSQMLRGVSAGELREMERIVGKIFHNMDALIWEENKGAAAQ